MVEASSDEWTIPRWVEQLTVKTNERINEMIVRRLVFSQSDEWYDDNVMNRDSDSVTLPVVTIVTQHASCGFKLVSVMRLTPHYYIIHNTSTVPLLQDTVPIRSTYNWLRRFPSGSNLYNGTRVIITIVTNCRLVGWWCCNVTLDVVEPLFGTGWYQYIWAACDWLVPNNSPANPYYY